VEGNLSDMTITVTIIGKDH